MNNKFLVGSRAFFECYEDFVPHDTDWVEMIGANQPFQYHHVMRNKVCHILLRWEKNAQTHINYALQQDCPLVVGKFLVPEFANAIHLTIDELKQLEPLLKKIDNKHKYQILIFDSYIANNDFTLTDEQRLAAYNEYKKQLLTNVIKMSSFYFVF